MKELVSLVAALKVTKGGNRPRKGIIGGFGTAELIAKGLFGFAFTS
jgi:hypothetical protein